MSVAAPIYNNDIHYTSQETKPTPSGFVYEEHHMPKQIGSYYLGRTIGRGAFCKVKIGTHCTSGVQYAVKVLKPQSRSSFLDLEKEIKVIGGLHHPNIISLRDILYINHNTDKVIVGHSHSDLSCAKILYVVVDLAKNGELFEYIIKKRRVDEMEARFLFRQLIGAIEYLHANCVAHRDLKPENILLDSNNNLKLNDFGLSNFVLPENKMKTFCGSPVYAAPEVMRKSYYSGPVADVWSLGVILFAMVTGCLPWKLNANTNRIENVDDLLAGRFDIPSDVSLSIECTSLLGRMLVPDPNKRSTLSEVRKHAWTNKGFFDYPSRFFPKHQEVTEVDKVIIKQMEAMGYMRARVTRDVLSNKVKPSVTVYHTLLKRLRYSSLSSSSSDSSSPSSSFDGGSLSAVESSAPTTPTTHMVSLYDPLAYTSSVSSTTSSSQTSSPKTSPPASPRPNIILPIAHSVSPQKKAYFVPTMVGVREDSDIVYLPHLPPPVLSSSPEKDSSSSSSSGFESDTKTRGLSSSQGVINNTNHGSSQATRRKSTGTSSPSSSHARSSSVDDSSSTSSSSSNEDGKRQGIFSKFFKKRTSSGDLSHSHN